MVIITAQNSREARRIIFYSIYTQHVGVSWSERTNRTCRQNHFRQFSVMDWSVTAFNLISCHEFSKFVINAAVMEDREFLERMEMAEKAWDHDSDDESYESDSDSEEQKDECPVRIEKMNAKYQELIAKCDSEENRLRNLRRLTASIELEIEQLQTHLGDLHFESCPATPAEVTARPKGKSRVVRSIPKSKVYHINGCRFYENERGIDFTEDEAEQRGLTICTHCAKK